MDVTGTVNLAVEGSASAPRLDAVQRHRAEQAGDVTLGRFARPAAAHRAAPRAGAAARRGVRVARPEVHLHGVGQRRPARRHRRASAAAMATARWRCSRCWSRPVSADERRSTWRCRARPGTRAAGHDRDRRWQHGRAVVAAGDGGLVGRRGARRERIAVTGTSRPVQRRRGDHRGPLPGRGAGCGGAVAGAHGARRVPRAAARTPQPDRRRPRSGATPAAVPACRATPPSPPARIASRPPSSRASPRR